ncbi:MAG: hypothetical protein HZB26_11340 [Candidatus Hydrogenedentes bacterium]|nr:hypothetical protein [Candidatus Hydrogenedentota bacterium]
MSLDQTIATEWNTIISSLALVVSLTTASWTIYRDRSAEGRIQVAAYLRTFAPPDNTGPFVDVCPHIGTYLYINAVNIGRRPVNLLCGGLVFKSEQPDGTNEILFSFPDSKATMLEEARMFTHEVPVRGFKVSDMRVIYLKDTFGHDWELPKASLDKLQAEEKREANGEA